MNRRKSIQNSAKAAGDCLAAVCFGTVQCASVRHVGWIFLLEVVNDNKLGAI